MKYFRYELKNIEPLRISDDSFSQSGQTTTLRYIPGATIRGFVVNKLSNDPNFESYKKILFSNKVRFLNAYLMADGNELLPSVKGFYEDKKADGHVKNVLATGEVDEGMKRAALGRYCYLDGDTIVYYNVETNSDMKIKIGRGEDQKVFRNEYVVPGYTFVGYIAIEDDKIEKTIEKTFSDVIVIGGQKSQALGKCEVVKKNYVNEKAYAYKSYVPKEDLKASCYMMLLSNTAMRGDDGQYEGLNLTKLGEKLGVENLQIEFCATSIAQVRGYNRAWQTKIPSIPMYEAGSVFKLTFDGTLTKKNMEALVDSGIGIRKNEGFGRVLFLKDYEKLDKKAEKTVERNVISQSKKATPEDLGLLKTAATNHYRKKLTKAMQDKIVAGNEKIGYMNGSQIGVVRSILFANRYNAKEGFRILEDYFVHGLEKEESQNIHKEKKSKIQFINYIRSVINTSYPEFLGLKNQTEIMGFKTKELLSEEELQRMKIDFILEVISYTNRKKGD